MAWQHRDLSHFRTSSEADLFGVHEHFARWLMEARPGGYNLYELAARSSPSTRISLREVPHSLLNLASYNYLGLSVRPEVIRAGQQALERYGLGAAGSPHLSGQLDVHDELAKQLAAFKRLEAALLFPSGYAANVGVLSALVQAGDTVVADLHSHASIFDGVAMSGARLRLFRHNDPVSLARKLEDTPGRKLVAVEGVYSMDGDIAPLREIAALCREHDARLLVDEAHSAFVFGANGRGLVEHFEVEDQVDVHIGTLSKSLGGIGGYVGGSKVLVDYLRAYARSQVFSCALAPPVAGGLLEALRIARDEPELRERLWRNVAVMREALLAERVDVGDSSSQVIPVFIRDDDRIFSIAEQLMAAGVYLNPIRYPAVKRHQSRLRISVSAAHSADELCRAAAVIGEVLRSRGVIQ